MKFGDNIKNLRISKNLSQEELAEKVGVSRQSVSKWECDTAFPAWNNIPTLCNIFNCNIEELVSGEELGKIMDLENLKMKSIKIEDVDTSDIISTMKSAGIDARIIEMFPKNSYNHLINTLEDYYISKLDGLERIKCELNNWDTEARKNIIIDLLKQLDESGPITVSDSIKLIELL